jgi:hypothetical protein
VCAIEFELLSADGKALRIEAGQHVRADKTLVDELRELCGAGAVEVIRETARAAASSSYN